MSEKKSADSGNQAAKPMASLTDTLPEGILPYSVSPVFTPESLPHALKTAHMIKAGTWGLLNVQTGVLRYVRDSVPPAEVILTAGQRVIIEPQVQHHVVFESAGSFQITFCRAARPRRQ